MIECVEITIVMDTIITKKTNTIATNVTSTVSINFRGEKVIDCYILQTVVLAIMLLLVINIVCYYFANQKGIIQNGKQRI